MKHNCICGQSKYKKLFQASVYSIVRCVYCNQIRTISPPHVKRTQEYSDSDIRVYLEKQEMFRSIFRRIIKFIQIYQRNGVLIDVGAGVGLLVDTANKMGFDAYGVEPSKPSVLASQKYFHVTLFSSILKLKANIAHANVILLNHVIEHVPNPKKMLEELSDLLMTHGYLVIGVPNIRSVIGSLKRARWQSLIPNQHRWHFSLRTLDNLVEPLGFSRLAVISDNHDRSIHPFWKRPIYWFLDRISNCFANGEAILVLYRKI